MTPERYQQVKQVFAEACRLAPDLRPEYLGHMCADDPDLRAEVEDLLAHDDKALPVAPQFSARDMLGAAPLDVHADAAAHAVGVYSSLERAPDRIGSFRVIRKIGQGGMGVVYEAEQDNPKRTIALKVIRPGAASEQILRRFKFEAHVLGRLQHPGIAQIYEAGTAEISHGGAAVEQPYFAMEYVRGKSLSELIPAMTLGTHDRLELFAKICDAVQHAHQKGVIHRDIKPGNILVDESGQPKILDFGVARVTDSDVQVTTMRTDVGQLIGTIPYMSPEQVAGLSQELDTRSDVYGLGVVCYQLLTGRLPHDLAGKTIPEATRAIAEDDPIRLSSINKIFRGDLETIVSKALEKDKERRYQSASDLAADVRRYLADEPILARPATTFYQMRKFARRNKTLVFGVAAVFVVLVLGVIGTTTQAVRAVREKNSAEAARQLAAERLLQAKAETRKFAAVNKFFNDMLLSMDPTRDGRDVKVADVLERAVANMDQGLRDQPEIESSLQNTIGTIYIGLGLHAEAEPFLRHALETLTNMLGADHPDTLVATTNLAAVLVDLSRWSEAEQYLRLTLKARRGTLGEDNIRTLDSMNNLGEVLYRQGRVEEAETQWRETLEIQRRALPPNDPKTLITMNNLAQLLKQQRKPDQAEPLLREVLAHQLETLGEEHPHTLITMNNLATTLNALDRYAEAEQLFRRILDTRLRTLGEDHPDVFATMNNLGNLLRDQGRLDEAEPLARRTWAGFRRILGAEHRQTLISMNNLASLLVKLGRAAEAEQIYTELLGIAREALPAGNYVTLIFESNYGECLARLERYEQAETLLFNSYEGLARALGEDHQHTHATREKIIALYEAWGKDDQAEHWRAPATEDDAVPE